MPHDLCQSVQRNGFRHPIAEAMTEFMRTYIDQFGSQSIFFDNMGSQHFYPPESPLRSRHSDFL